MHLDDLEYQAAMLGEDYLDRTAFRFESRDRYTPPLRPDITRGQALGAFIDAIIAHRPFSISRARR